MTGKIDCGCHIETRKIEYLPAHAEPERTIVYCDMHEAARELVEASLVVHNFLTGMFSKVPDDKVLSETRACIARLGAALKKAGFQ